MNEAQQALYNARLKAEVQGDPEHQYADKTNEQIADIINNGWIEQVSTPKTGNQIGEDGKPVLEQDPMKPTGYMRIVQVTTNVDVPLQHHDAIWRVILRVEGAPNQVSAADITTALES